MAEFGKLPAPGRPDLTVLQWLVQQLVSYDRPPIRTGRPNWIETVHNSKKWLVFFKAYK